MTFHNCSHRQDKNRSVTFQNIASKLTEMAQPKSHFVSTTRY